MPQWRKLHTKTTESLDINDMPDDFTRLTWVLLPLKLCREGRGYDIPAWIKSQIYPLRSDVSGEMVETAMDWFEARGMIERYTVSGRPYFRIKSWSKYQGNTSREAESPYPGPAQAEPESDSRPTHEQFPNGSGTDVDVDAEEKRVDADACARAQPLVSAYCSQLDIPEPSLVKADPADWVKPALKILRFVENEGEGPDLVRATILYMDERGLSYKNLSSLVNTARTVSKQRDSGADCERAWSVVEEAFSRGDGSILKDHPRVLAAVDAIGGWGQLKQSRDSDIPFVKKRFAQEYGNVRT